jgi:hypothetical protein
VNLGSRLTEKFSFFALLPSADWCYNKRCHVDVMHAPHFCPNSFTPYWSLVTDHRGLKINQSKGKVVPPLEHFLRPC